MKKNNFLFNLYKILAIILTMTTYSCATYHSKSIQYQTQIQNGLFNEASESVEANKFLKKKRNKLLYYLEKGKVSHLKGDYKISNELFNKADFFIEDYQKNIGNEILGIITNPEKKPYRGEDFEKVAIHYYKSLNYIFLNQLDEALVEAKRINLQLQKINEKYPEGKKNRYTSDAFALNLQGLLYEATGNINDAFISYRNSIDLYLLNKGSYFGVPIPEQLKKDLLKTAHQLGFTNEKERYSKLLEYNYVHENNKFGEAIVFWENGLVPYKDQTFYSFTVLPGQESGLLNINNEQLGLNLQVPIANNGNSKNSFSDIDIFNVSFPKYVYRKPFNTEAKVILDSVSYPLHLVQDYNDIAFKTLKDRTLREIGEIALRLAVKKVSEYTVKNKNENLGTVLGIFNALTERSDTRNWQTLPSTILYARFPLKKGENKVQIIIDNQETSEEFIFEGSGNIKFLNYATPKSAQL